MSKKPYTYGMIHGRFQPFHQEHLRYFKIAWEKSENVIVGITNPDPSAIKAEDASPHRHKPEDNPFTYIQRLMMIREALQEEGFPLERVLFVPFPIHHPDRWMYYVPPGTAMFVISYSEWERNKAERLRQAGLEVVEVDNLEKGISGQQIRALIAAGDAWDHLVPAGAARFLGALLREKE